MATAKERMAAMRARKASERKTAERPERPGRPAAGQAVVALAQSLAGLSLGGAEAALVQQCADLATQLDGEDDPRRGLRLASHYARLLADLRKCSDANRARSRAPGPGKVSRLADLHARMAAEAARPLRPHEIEADRRAQAILDGELPPAPLRGLKRDTPRRAYEAERGGGG